MIAYYNQEIKDVVMEREPSCFAAALIIENRDTGGELLKNLQSLENPTYGDLLARHLIQRESAWKEEDLWKRKL